MTIVVCNVDCRGKICLITNGQVMVDLISTQTQALTCSVFAIASSEKYMVFVVYANALIWRGHYSAIT